MSKTMQGRRIPDNSTAFAEGDYAKHISDEGKVWWECRPPGCHLGSLRGHDVVEHEDGTITVTPSILLTEPNGPGWHGYLERGVWRVC
jgi:hypothetical protein